MLLSPLETLAPFDGDATTAGACRAEADLKSSELLNGPADSKARVELK